jgi:hypothetical protein
VVTLTSCTAADVRRGDWVYPARVGRFPARQVTGVEVRKTFVRIRRHAAGALVLAPTALVYVDRRSS